MTVVRGLTCGQTATIGYWQNRNGQKLIKSLNGGETATQLGNWLAQTFPNLYASLAGKTNAQVTAYHKALFSQTGNSSQGPVKTNAQVLATAFAVYVTNEFLAGTVATAYGFRVSEIGTGTRTFDVGSNGAVFGVANGSRVTIRELLLSVNARSQNGMLGDINGNGAIDATEASYRTKVNNLFSAINEAGDI